MTYLKRWIGVDPGDRWLGLAILTQVDAKLWQADMAVVDQSKMRLHTIITKFTRLLKPGDAVVPEDFNIRTIGHQKFSQGQTLRFLGALEYVTKTRECSFHLVPPGDPEQLDSMFWAKYMEHWQPHWSAASNTNWRHAKSAWRALMIQLMIMQPELFTNLRDARIVEKAKFLRATHEAFWPPAPNDLYATSMVWRMQHARD